MVKYEVTINFDEEYVEVDAENEEEALKKVEEMFSKKNIIELNPDFEIEELDED